MNRKNYSIGILLIFVAIILLLGKLGVFSYIGVMLWPLLIILVGAAFHFLFFSGLLPAGLLVPGGILVTHGFIFLVCNIFSWDLMKYLWPGFILGVAIGLYEYYIFNNRSERGLLIASMIIGVVSLVMFGMTLLLTIGIYLIIAVLLLAGLFMIIRKPKIW
jgi:hypothetical protein